MNEKQLEQFITMQNDITNIKDDVAEIKETLKCFIEKSEDHAYALADSQMFSDALGDTTWGGVDIAVLEEITHVDQLEMYGWDGKCIPYGDTDGNTRIEEILK